MRPTRTECAPAQGWSGHFQPNARNDQAPETPSSLEDSVNLFRSIVYRPAYNIEQFREYLGRREYEDRLSRVLSNAGGEAPSAADGDRRAKLSGMVSSAGGAVTPLPQVSCLQRRQALCLLLAVPSQAAILRGFEAFPYFPRCGLFHALFRDQLSVGNSLRGFNPDAATHDVLRQICGNHI